MSKEKIDIYLTANAKYFDASVIPLIKEKLEKSSDDILYQLQACDLKDPTFMLLISLLFGTFGIDRFLLEDIGIGILKILTAGCCGILTVIDWCYIMQKTKEYNFAKINMIL